MKEDFSFSVLPELSHHICLSLAIDLAYQFVLLLVQLTCLCRVVPQLGEDQFFHLRRDCRELGQVQSAQALPLTSVGVKTPENGQL